MIFINIFWGVVIHDLIFKLEVLVSNPIANEFFSDSLPNLHNMQLYISIKSARGKHVRTVYEVTYEGNMAITA